MQLAHAELEDVMMAMVGLETMAYIKPITEGMFTSYAVFAADGTKLAMFDTAESAYYNAVRHNLAPMSLH
jgi:hypothetical protein